MVLFEYKNYNIEKYKNFILECKTKNYNGGKVHKHHIIPKFMKGTDVVENIINLSYQDHFNAHIILAECFPKNTKEYKGNLCAAMYISKWIDSESSVRDLATKISDSKKGIPRPKHVIDKLIKANSLENLSEKQRLERSNRMKELIARGLMNQKPPKWTESRKQKARDRMAISQNGKDNPTANRIQHIETGRVYDTLKDVMEEFGYTNYSIIYRKISKNIFKVLDKPLINGLKGSDNKLSKRIQHTESGQIFYSIKDAMTHHKVSNYSVMERLVRQNIFKVL